MLIHKYHGVADQGKARIVHLAVRITCKLHAGDGWIPEKHAATSVPP